MKKQKTSELPYSLQNYYYYLFIIDLLLVHKKISHDSQWLVENDIQFSNQSIQNFSDIHSYCPSQKYFNLAFDLSGNISVGKETSIRNIDKTSRHRKVLSVVHSGRSNSKPFATLLLPVPHQFDDRSFLDFLQ